MAKNKKLKWNTDSDFIKDSCAEVYTALLYKIHYRYSVRENGYVYELSKGNNYIGIFKKLSTAKKVAQLIHNE